jgi:hypothetical protein
MRSFPVQCLQQGAGARQALLPLWRPQPRPDGWTRCSLWHWLSFAPLSAMREIDTQLLDLEATRLLVNGPHILYRRQEAA